ncbi:MAG: hypothetical protein GC199_00145 [Alphaproteobacteria bacterium]|nr:hypothetical protein [Alphaproteobacteria bacterium]
MTKPFSYVFGLALAVLISGCSEPLDPAPLAGPYEASDDSGAVCALTLETGEKGSAFALTPDPACAGEGPEGLSGAALWEPRPGGAIRLLTANGTIIVDLEPGEAGLFEAAGGMKGGLVLADARADAAPGVGLEAETLVGPWDLTEAEPGSPRCRLALSDLPLPSGAYAVTKEGVCAEPMESYRIASWRLASDQVHLFNADDNLVAAFTLVDPSVWKATTREGRELLLARVIESE